MSNLKLRKMKRWKISSVLVLITVGFCILIMNCSKSSDYGSVDPLIMEFIKSKDFQTNELLSCKSIDYAKSNVKYLNDCKEKPIITVVFSEGDKIIGSVEAVKNTNRNILLPNGGSFFMMYRDFEKFDFVNETGSIDLYDLNYDNYLFGGGLIESSMVIISNYYPIPLHTLQRYQDIILLNREYFSKNNKFKDQNEIKSASKPCDGNSDGNVSFGECYKCYKDACNTDATCMVLCYLIGDAVGATLTKVPLCQGSIAAACVYISIYY